MWIDSDNEVDYHDGEFLVDLSGVVEVDDGLMGTVKIDI